jgi:hemoglobin
VFACEHAAQADFCRDGVHSYPSFRLEVYLPHFGTACHCCSMQTVYEAAGGADFFLTLANAWHARVMADEVVSHAFSHGFHPEHSRRLAAYWGESLGGPPSYSGSYGDETSVVRIHSGNGPHEDMDRRAIACFDQALTDVGLTDGKLLRKVLRDYFAWATTNTMSRYQRSADDVPDGLRIRQWSWDGLVYETGSDATD